MKFNHKDKKSTVHPRCTVDENISPETISLLRYVDSLTEREPAVLDDAVEVLEELNDAELAGIFPAAESISELRIQLSRELIDLDISLPRWNSVGEISLILRHKP